MPKKWESFIQHKISHNTQQTSQKSSPIFSWQYSKDNFKNFRQKVKHIGSFAAQLFPRKHFHVNNSNYGATVKAEKLAPVVRGWRNYHRFCKMDGKRFSLYHIQHRTFKLFNKETLHNRYTSKKLQRQSIPCGSLLTEQTHLSQRGENTL